MTTTTHLQSFNIKVFMNKITNPIFYNLENRLLSISIPVLLVFLCLLNTFTQVFSY